MRIQGIVWFDDIIEKLSRKHHVHQNEVRDILDSRPHFRHIEKGHRAGEDVYAAMGQTKGGRCLIVFFVHKKDGRAIILTARDMTKAERRQYEKN